MLKGAGGDMTINTYFDLLCSEIRKKILEKCDNIEKVRIRNGEIHAYGRMPNSTDADWYFVGYVRDYECKGFEGLALN